MILQLDSFESSKSLDTVGATALAKARLIRQEDNLLPLLTVKKTLMFSAKFRLRGINSREQELRVENLMQELGVLHVADSFVGDEETRGISGGEGKREYQ
ncbi:hypothetical protein NE237_005338 [Protea cynaroides]|uniref:Uncharacterized protein n=1 Tax=Protea cynaroides TaxID=273540 RepID=A0A9Q0QUJ0_9MAGN|nr:hypothetical protein NE237_005338 [Protea cynaroides]